MQDYITSKNGKLDFEGITLAIVSLGQPRDRATIAVLATTKISTRKNYILLHPNTQTSVYNCTVLYYINTCSCHHFHCNR